MKKTVKALLIGLIAVMCVCCAVACNPTVSGVVRYEDKIVADLIDTDQKFTYDSSNAYGEEPDLDNVVIDGHLDDELWQNKKWYTQYKTENPNFVFSVTATVSEKGLYVAAKSTDEDIYWNGRGRFYYNTNIQLQVGGLNLKIDANGSEMRQPIYNVRATYGGELNVQGGAKGLFVECFFTWQQLGYNEPQEYVAMFPTYWYTLRQGTAPVALYPTFVNNGGNSNSMIKFDRDGYMDGDEENAKVGTHTFGLAKTNGWQVENAGTDEETYTALTTSGNTGYLKAAFFRNLFSQRYMISTRITFHSAKKNNVRAGLLMYVNNMRYRAISVDVNDSTLVGGVLKSAPINAYTNYPSNITTTTPIGEYTGNTEDGRKANEVDLTIFNNGGLIYYLVNGEFIYSESADYINNSFGGFYVFNADATFSNYEYQEFRNEAEIKEEIAKYSYTVEIKNENANGISGELSQIATANTGDGEVNVILTFGNSRKVSEGYRVNELDKLYYTYIDKNGETKEVDLTEDFMKNAVAGVYTIKNVPGNITVHTRPKAETYSEDELVTLSLRMWDNQNGNSVMGVQSLVEGNGPMDRFVVNNGQGGYMSLMVAKGSSWKFTSTKQGYRATEGVFNEGAIVNEDMITKEDEDADAANDKIPEAQKRKVQVVNMIGTVIGGDAISVRKPDGSNYTSLVKGSSPGIYWDLSEEETGKVVFTSTNTGSSVIYYSGRTISDYQVAYVEITNQTDYLAFQSIEDDPAAGFMISNAGRDAFAGLCGTGVRILPNRAQWTPIDKKGLANYSGPLAKIDRNNNGRLDLDNPYSMGTGTVNRIPINGVTYTTSLLMIRRGGAIYMYVANGSAGVKPDKTNFNKLTPIFQTYLPDSQGSAALGFYVTVSYNLRLDFENYWILSGSEQAGAFADDIISSKIKLTGSDIVSLESDGLSGYDESTGEGRIAVSSEVTLKAKNTLPEGKIIKITKNDGSVVYLNENGISNKFNVGTDKKDITIKAEYVDSVRVTGNIEISDKDITVAGRTGHLYDKTGKEVASFVTDETGSYSLNIEKNVDFTLSVDINGYAMNPVQINTDSNMNAGTSKFIKLKFGSKSGSFETNQNMMFGIDDQYHGAYAHWETSTIGDTALTINPEYNNKEEFVLTFSYVRSSAKSNNATVGDEKDPGIGIIMNGDDASNIQFLAIGNGYRILRPDWNSRVETRNVSRINTQKTDVTIDNYAMIKIIKKSNVFYLLTKYSNDESYTLSLAWTAKDASDTEIFKGSVNFAIKFTVTDGTYFNVTLFDIDVQEVNKDTAPEIISSVTLEQSEGGLLEVDGIDGNVGEVVGADSLAVTVTPAAEKKLKALRVNGVEVDLGNYTSGVFTGNVNVNGDSVITVEYADMTYQTMITGLKRNERSAQLIVITNGTTTIRMTVTKMYSQLSETKAYIDDSAQTLTLFAPKGTWTVTLYSDTAGTNEISTKDIEVL